MNNPTPILPPHRTPVPALKAAARHAARSPIYLFRLAARIPRGLRAIFAPMLRWVRDEANVAAYQAALVASPGQYQKLREARDEMLAKRRAKLWLLAAAVSLGVAVSEWFGHGWVWRAAAAALLVAAIAAGGRRDPGAPPALALLAPKAARAAVDTEAIRKAFCSALPKIAKACTTDPDALSLIDPPVRDGTGWAARVELPGGVTAAEVIRESDRLASAFGKAPLAVSVEPDPGHAGRVSLWVGDKSPEGDVAWTLENAEMVDVLGRFPIGEDLRGRPFEITLADKNVLIGAMPNYGKTATLRMILLAAALDPRADIYAFDLKGGTDLLPLESCAVKVAAGDEDEDIAELLAALREVRAEVSARNKIIRSLPVHERTDGKVTSADATRLGWAPIVFAIDEAQIAYENETYGEEIAKLTIDIFKRGRSVGIHMMLATQQFDASSIPTKVTGNAHLRMCGRVEGWQASNMVLGANAHSSGYSATRLTAQGVMWVKGATDVPAVVRMAKVTAEQAWQIARRASAVRGMAPVVERQDEPPPAPVLQLVPRTEPVKVALADQLLAAWPAGVERMTPAALGQLVGWDPAQLTKALRDDYGILTRPLWIDRKTQRGLERADLESCEVRT